MANSATPATPKEDKAKTEAACQKEACRLQDCLWRNDFQQNRCQGALRGLAECCNALLAQGQTSRCCPSSKME